MRHSSKVFIVELRVLAPPSKTKEYEIMIYESFQPRTTVKNFSSRNSYLDSQLEKSLFEFLRRRYEPNT